MWRLPLLIRAFLLPTIPAPGRQADETRYYHSTLYHSQYASKFLKLCAILNRTSEDERLLLRAKLENLWLWVMRYFPMGELRSCSAQQIALACSWSDNPETWVNALVECRFLESTGAGYTIVNWEEYGGKQTIKRQRDAMHKQRVRNQDQQIETPVIEPAIIQSIDGKNDFCCPVVDNVMSQSPSAQEVSRSAADDSTPHLSDGGHADKAPSASNVRHLMKTHQSNELYSLYPRPGAKAASLKAIRKALDRIPYETLHRSVLDLSEQNRQSPGATPVPLANEWFKRRFLT